MPLILVPYVSRTIGVERYGISEYALEFATFFGTILLYGYDFTMSKKLSRNRESKAYYSQLFWNVFYSRLTISAIIIPVFWITGSFFLDDLFSDKLLLFAFVFVISRMFSSWWFFQGMEDIKWIAVGNFLIKALILGSVLLLVKSEVDYPFVVLAFGLSQLFINLLAWLWIRRRFDIQFIHFRLLNILQLLRSSFFTFFNEFLIMTFTTMNILIVKNYLSPEELGFYAATIKVVIIIQNLVIQSLSKSLFPNLARAYKQNKKAYELKLNNFRNLLIIVLIVVGIFILLGKDLIVQVLFGNNFSEVSSLLMYVSFLPLFIGISNIYGWQGLYILNKEKTMAYISLFVGLFSIVSLLLITEKYKIIGVLLVRNISEIMIFVLAYYFFKKAIRSETL